MNIEAWFTERSVICSFRGTFPSILFCHRTSARLQFLEWMAWGASKHSLLLYGNSSVPSSVPRGSWRIHLPQPSPQRPTLAVGCGELRGPRAVTAGCSVLGSSRVGGRERLRCFLMDGRVLRAWLWALGFGMGLSAACELYNANMLLVSEAVSGAGTGGKNNMFQ